MMAKRLKSGTSEDEMMAAFRAFDDDGNGYISASELRQALLKLGERMSEAEIVDMIREADMDGDGLVNYSGLYYFYRTVVFPYASKSNSRTSKGEFPFNLVYKE